MESSLLSHCCFPLFPFYSHSTFHSHPDSSLSFLKFSELDKDNLLNYLKKNSALLVLSAKFVSCFEQLTKKTTTLKLIFPFRSLWKVHGRDPPLVQTNFCDAICKVHDVNWCSLCLHAPWLSSATSHNNFTTVNISYSSSTISLLCAKASCSLNRIYLFSFLLGTAEMCVINSLFRFKPRLMACLFSVAFG